VAAIADRAVMVRLEGRGCQLSHDCAPPFPWSEGDYREGCGDGHAGKTENDQFDSTVAFDLPFSKLQLRR